MAILRFGFLSFLLFIVLTNAEGPSVYSNLGTINGDRTRIKFRGKSYNVDRYFGIPYAKPPVGDMRFKKPEPYGPFQEPFNAVKLPPSCPQYEYPGLKMTLDEQSEDCLFLNVYVPNQEPDQASGHAVMFFIHGGGFAFGTGIIYRAEVLASVGNVIVVTINYRLGLLGFLNLRDDRARGNFGLWDQRLALQWVNQNIGAFGGDKDRVTIFGESAGSISVTLQMFYPPNKGLFTSAIAESGTITMPQLIRDDSIETAKFYAENMSCPVETIDQIFNCLMSASSESIVKVGDDALKADISVAMKIATIPTTDGEFLKVRPSELVKRAQIENTPEVEFFRSIKLINGVNGAEGAMFLVMSGDPNNLEAFEINREDMNTQQVPAIAAMAFGSEPAVPDVVKKMIQYEYTNWVRPDDPKTLRNEMVRAYGDVMFNVPGIEISRLHTNGSNAGSYFYSFVAFLDLHLISTPVWVGKANHGDELVSVFGYNFDYEYLRNLTDYRPPEWELELSTRMMTYWTNFAKTGDPNPPSSSSVLIEWPQYDLGTQRHLIFDRQDSLGQYLYAKEIHFWRNILRPVYDELTHAQTITAQYTKDMEGTCEKDGTCG